MNNVFDFSIVTNWIHQMLTSLMPEGLAILDVYKRQTYNLLNTITFPEDLRQLSVEELPEVCKELRQDIIKAVSYTHLLGLRCGKGNKPTHTPELLRVSNSK